MIKAFFSLVANVVISVVGYRFYLLVRGSYNYNMPTEKKKGVVNTPLISFTLFRDQ